MFKLVWLKFEFLFTFLKRGQNMIRNAGRRMPNFDIFTKKNVLLGGLGVLAGAGAVDVANNLNTNSKSPSESVTAPPTFKGSQHPYRPTTLPPYIATRPGGIRPASSSVSETPKITFTRFAGSRPTPIPQPSMEPSAPLPPSTRHHWPAPAPYPPPIYTQPTPPPPPTYARPMLPPPSTYAPPMTQHHWPTSVTPPPASMPPCDQNVCAPLPPSYQSRASSNNRIGNTNRNRRTRSLDSMIPNLAEWALKTEEDSLLAKEIELVNSYLEQNNTDRSKFKF